MRTWPALLLAPLVALGQQSLMYALVPPACQGGLAAALHAIAGASVLACAVMTALAWREHAAADTGPDDAAGARRRTLAAIGAMTGALSTLVCAAMWAPVWLVSPCLA